MSGFLTNLLARSLGPVAAVRPRSPSQFEPLPVARGATLGEPAAFETPIEEIVSPRPLSTIAIPPPKAPRISPAEETRADQAVSNEDHSVPKQKISVEHAETSATHTPDPNPKTIGSAARSDDQVPFATEISPSGPPHIDPFSMPGRNRVSEQGETPLEPIRAGLVTQAKNSSDEINDRTPKISPSGPPHIDPFGMPGGNRVPERGKPLLEPIRAGMVTQAKKSSDEINDRAPKPDARHHRDENEVEFVRPAIRPEMALQPREPVDSFRASDRVRELPLKSSNKPAVKALDRPKSVERAAPRRAETVAPEIHVNIGRIEVRAVIQPIAVTQSRPTPERRKEIVSLNDYLKERQAGGRR